ncbi:MAG: preprotein translocase subunit SecE [Opitutales bacterium]
MANPFSKIRQFYKETITELKRVSWPTFKEVRLYMLMVFVSLSLMGAFLFVADFSITNVIALFTELVKSI